MKMKVELVKKLLPIGVAVLLGISSHLVLARDAKSIPGSNCVDGSNQDDVTYINGALRNDVGVNWVSCPIVRDNMGAQSQHFANTVKVRLFKSNSTATVCILVSSTWSGNLGTSLHASVSGTGYKTVYIPGTISSYTSGYMSVECRLNAGDSIFSVVYDER